MVFFDTEEHQIREVGIHLANIPKLGPQWRILYDFKPTEYLFGLPEPAVSLFVDLENYFGPGIVFSCSPNNSPSIALDNLVPGPGLDGLESNQPPKLGEWTRIAISHEEENGQWILSLSVGGREVGRCEVGYLELGRGELPDVKIYIGNGPFSDGPIQPGFIKGLVVLDKQ